MDITLLKILSPFSSIRSVIDELETHIKIDEENLILVENLIFAKSLISRASSNFKKTSVKYIDEYDITENLKYNVYGVQIIWKKKVRRSEELKYNFFTKAYKYYLQPKQVVIHVFKIDEFDSNIQNIFKKERQLFYRSVLGPIVKTKKNLINQIMTNNKFIERINSINKSRSALVKVKRYLKEISTDKNFDTLKYMKRTLDIVFHLTIEGIYVDKSGIDKVRELSKTKQIVYLPSHRSHVDYLLIGYLLLKYNLDVPLVAAGVNLAFFPVGRPFRRSGAYFLRRSFKGNPLYAESFYTYLDMLMKQRSNQMFYIEGGRSRSGKLLAPKFGMLNMLVKSFLDNNLDDLYFVPLSTEYGKLFEGKSYIEELSGADKQKESIFAMFDTLKFLKKREGITYMQFSEPFSLREYMANLSFTEFNDQVKFESFIQTLGFDVLHRINKVVTITPSAIISIVLLSNPKRGIKKNDLVRICHIIYLFLKRRNYRLAINETAFEGQIEHVLNNFTENKYVNSVVTDIDVIYKVQDTYRPFLDYYKNNIIHLFLPLAFISVVLKSSKKEQLKLDELFKEIESLKELFDYEFVYDHDVWQKDTILETLKFLRFLKEIKVIENDVKFDVSNSIWTEITRNIILNFLESYHIVFSKLLKLKEPINEKDFFNQLRSYSQALYEVGEIKMIESNSTDTYKNALTFCFQKGLVNRENKQIIVIDEMRNEIEQTLSKINSYLL